MSHDLLRVHPFVPEQLVLHVTVDCRQNVTSLFPPETGLAQSGTPLKQVQPCHAAVKCEVGVRSRLGLKSR